MTTTELSNACAVQDEAPTHLAPQDSFPVPLEALGRDIVAEIEAGDKARGRADEIVSRASTKEARARGPDFSVFLRDHCTGLSRSRAYELVAIAEGKAEEVRSNNRTRDRRRREKAARVREPRTCGISTRKPQAPKSQAQWALAEFRVAVDTYFAKMDDEAKRAAFAYVKSKASVVSP